MAKGTCSRCHRAPAAAGHAWCRDCSRDYMRGRKGDPTKRLVNAKASAARHPDRRRAREKVKDAIRRGDIPPAKKLACKDCGGKAAAYDHLDYAQPLAVEPVCHPCHGKRSRARGQHRKSSRDPLVTPRVGDWFDVSTRPNGKPAEVRIDFVGDVGNGVDEVCYAMFSPGAKLPGSLQRVTLALWREAAAAQGARPRAARKAAT